MILDLLMGIFFALIYSFAGFLDGTSFIFCLIASIIFSILPDVDIIHDIVKQGKVAAHAKNPRDHRDFIHHPIPYLIIGSLVIGYLCLLFGGNTIGWISLFSILSLWHFAHDSFGTGWGIKWLSPFSQDSFKFYTNPSNGEYDEQTLLVRWTPEVKKELIIHFGRLDWADGEDGKVTAKSLFLVEKKVTIVVLLIIIVCLIIFL